MPSVQLHSAKYEQLIERRGRVVLWQEAIMCSCWNIDSGQPTYNCPACYGKGFRYGSGYKAKALVMSTTVNKDFEESAGMFEVGDAVMTVPKRIPQKNSVTNIQNNTMTNAIDNPMYDIGMYDIVTLMDDEYKSSEILQMGIQGYGKPADTLLNEQVTRIKYVESVDIVTGNVISYKEGVDYTLDKNKLIWSPSAFESGLQYSVTYFHHPVYTVFANLPNSRQQDGQDLPLKVALRYRAGGIERR